MRVLLINGPNLNLLGTRQPETYGDTTLAQLEERFSEWAAELSISTDAFQSNGEGALIDRIHAARGSTDAIVFNPGAYTHTSYALHDAVEAVEIPTVETHISNVKEREPWRAVSVIAPACVHQIYGRGIDGYRWALRHVAARAARPADRIHYGAHPDQFVDLRIEPGSSRLAVLIHGGFWRHMWTFDTLDLNAVDLADRGYHVASIEYRRVGAGGGWPQTAEDVDAAIAASIDHLPEPPEEIVVIGHSAGGQLALEAAGRLEGPYRVTVASMAGITDMVDAVETGIGDGAAAAYLSGADPRAASPIEHRPSFRVITAHGSADDEVPVHHARVYADRHGATLLETPGGDHYGFLDVENPMWTGLMELLETSE